MLLFGMRDFEVHAYPVRCYPEGWAAPGFVPCQRNTWKPLSKLKRTFPPRKINVTSKSPVGDISVVTLIRTDTTLDHSQKAEKVWVTLVQNCLVPGNRYQTERVTKYTAGRKRHLAGTS